MEQLKGFLAALAALSALVLISPLLLAIALWISLDSPGSIIFRQPRVGMNGKEFSIYKFRTMFDARYTRMPEIPPAQSEEEAKFRRDFCCERCVQPAGACDCETRAGRFLRATSLDELPQLWNIVRGDMTFVGPRPTLREQVAQYSPRERLRLAVKPGITGLAQVSGRNQITWDTKIALDLWYVEHRSLWLDFTILIRTLLRA